MAATGSPASADDEDCRYQVRHLAADEELVIDGETAVDDMLVAQRIAEMEVFAAQTAAEAPNAAPAAGRPPLNQGDVSRLLSLLQQTTELSKQVCDLPSKFDKVVGSELKKALRAAAEAMEKLPTSEAMPGAVSVEAAVEIARKKNAASLEGVNLDSTDEEDDDAGPGHGSDAGVSLPKESSKQSQANIAAAKVAPVVKLDQQRVGGDLAGKLLPKREEQDNDEEEEEEAAQDIFNRLGGDAVFMREDEDDFEESPNADGDNGLLQVCTDSIPEKLEDHADMTSCGSIHALVDGLVVVRGDVDSRALDLQSVLCLANRKVIGVIIDVFGPLKEPYYLVFPTGTPKIAAELGAEVFAATDMPETSYLLRDSNDLAELQGAFPDGDDEDEDDDDDGEDETECKRELVKVEEKPMLQDAEAALGERDRGEAPSKGKSRKGKGKGKGKGMRKGKGAGDDSTSNAAGTGRSSSSWDANPVTERQGKGSSTKGSWDVPSEQNGADYGRQPALKSDRAFFAKEEQEEAGSPGSTTNRTSRGTQENSVGRQAGWERPAAHGNRSEDGGQHGREEASSWQPNGAGHLKRKIGATGARWLGRTGRSSREEDQGRRVDGREGGQGWDSTTAGRGDSTHRTPQGGRSPTLCPPPPPPSAQPCGAPQSVARSMDRGSDRSPGDLGAAWSSSITGGPGGPSRQAPTQRSRQGQGSWDNQVESAPTKRSRLQPPPPPPPPPRPSAR